MLKIGIIGFGNRITYMMNELDKHGIPYAIQAISDPRSGEIKEKNIKRLGNTVFYTDMDEMLKKEKPDGIMIGTRCFLHTDIACKVAPYEIPLFIEKPVAITYKQVKKLHKVYKNHKAPVVVSFPLRVTPIAEKIKEIISSGQVGTIEQVDAFNDVPYGWA